MVQVTGVILALILFVVLLLAILLLLGGIVPGFQNAFTSFTKTAVVG